MLDQVFYLFSAVLLGLVVGALIMYFATGSNKDSEQTIAKLEKELANYQQDVVEHFEQTADLVDGMTKSYKKVFDHLGKSARKLMTEEQIQKQLELRKGNKVTLEYLTESSENEELDNKGEVVSNSNKDIVEELSIIKIDDEPEESLVMADESEFLDDEQASIETEISDNGINEEAGVNLEKEVEIREKNIYS